MTDPLLDIEDVSVAFGGTQALNAVSLTIPASCMYGIIGPNGAGKTTLFNCITGFVRPTRSSKITFNGVSLIDRPLHKIAQLGVSRTFQNIALIRDATGRENILLGLHTAIAYSAIMSIFPLRYIGRAESEARRLVEEIAEILKLSRNVLDSPVSALPNGALKKIEVARATVRKPKLLLLDEPAGGLNDAETADFVQSLDLLREWGALTVVLIDHDMNLVMEVCERIAVLNFGNLIAEGAPSTIQADPDVIEVYLGDSRAS
jgi:branched-chain amino acid transport system ATP-binding protein